MMNSQEVFRPMPKDKMARRKARSILVVSRAKKAQRDAAELLGRARSEAVRLANEVQRLQNDFETYVERNSKELKASRQQIQLLSRRVHHLEQLVKPGAHAENATRMQVPPSPSRSLFTLLGRPSFPFAGTSTKN